MHDVTIFKFQGAGDSPPSPRSAYTHGYPKLLEFERHDALILFPKQNAKLFAYAKKKSKEYKCHNRTVAC